MLDELLGSHHATHMIAFALIILVQSETKPMAMAVKCRLCSRVSSPHAFPPLVDQMRATDLASYSSLLSIGHCVLHLVPYPV